MANDRYTEMRNSHIEIFNLTDPEDLPLTYDSIVFRAARQLIRWGRPEGWPEITRWLELSNQGHTIDIDAAFDASNAELPANYGILGVLTNAPGGTQFREATYVDPTRMMGLPEYRRETAVYEQLYFTMKHDANATPSRTIETYPGTRVANMDAKIRYTSTPSTIAGNDGRDTLPSDADDEFIWPEVLDGALIWLAALEIAAIRKDMENINLSRITAERLIASERAEASLQPTEIVLEQSRTLRRMEALRAKDSL